MIRYKQLLTIKLYDKDTNQPIGRIDDVIYSDDYKKISSLIIKNDNLIKNKAIINYNDVFFVNNNKIIYLNNTNIFKSKLQKNLEDKKEGIKFLEKEVINENNHCIGYIKDVVINIENGTIDGFIITEGLFEDLIKGRNYIPLLDNIEINDNHIFIPNNIHV